MLILAIYKGMYQKEKLKSDLFIVSIFTIMWFCSNYIKKEIRKKCPGHFYSIKIGL